VQVQAVIKSRGHDKGTWYAMKTLTKSVILERNHVAMVMKERNLLSRLHCPQLVNMHYAFQDAKNLYIIMDVCLGGDLHYQLTHSPSRSFAEEQTRFYVASIILCLDYMHSECSPGVSCAATYCCCTAAARTSAGNRATVGPPRHRCDRFPWLLPSRTPAGVGVMHRDVKPENLLLDSRGQLKVTDLGISMETVDGVCTSTSGTRPYMAPEIFMAGHRHSYVADYYALGASARSRRRKGSWAANTVPL
jgi:serine/threonine protein kinase